MYRWGIIGYGNIAKRFIKGLSYSQQGELYAVASRSKDVDEDVVVYRDYEALYQDEQVDAVYIALPHFDHLEQARLALKYNKAVLCEKPATLSKKDTQELIDLSRTQNVFFLEAMKSRFIPLMDDIHQFIDDGELGDIKHIETSFCSDVPYMEHHYLYDKKQGGALYDVGIYNTAFILDFINSPIQSIETMSRMKYGVDSHVESTMTFESGQSAKLNVSIDEAREKCGVIVGTKGTMTLTPFYRPTECCVTFNDGQTMTMKRDYCFDDFYGEIEEVHNCLHAGEIESLRFSHADSLKCIEVLNQIKETING